MSVQELSGAEHDASPQVLRDGSEASETSRLPADDASCAAGRDALWSGHLLARELSRRLGDDGSHGELVDEEADARADAWIAANHRPARKTRITPRARPPEGDDEMNTTPPWHGFGERLARLETRLEAHETASAERHVRLTQDVGEVQVGVKGVEMAVAGLSERHWKLVVALASAGLLGSAAGGGVGEALKMVLGL